MHRSVVAFLTRLSILAQPVFQTSPLFMRILLSSVRSASSAGSVSRMAAWGGLGFQFRSMLEFWVCPARRCDPPGRPRSEGIPPAICLWESFAGSVWYHWWQSRETNSSSYMSSSHWGRPWRSQDSLWMTVSFKHPDFNHILTLWGGWYKATMCLYVFNTNLLVSLIAFKIWDKWFSLACLGFEISEYQKRQAAMTVRKVTKQKGEATRRYQVIFFTFLSSLVCSVFSSLFTLHRICFLTFLTCHIFFLNKHTHYVYEWT